MKGRGRPRAYPIWRPTVEMELCESIGGISAMIAGLKNKEKITDIRDWCNWLLKKPAARIPKLMGVGRI